MLFHLIVGYSVILSRSNKGFWVKEGGIILRTVGEEKIKEVKAFGLSP